MLVQCKKCNQDILTEADPHIVNPIENYACYCLGCFDKKDEYKYFCCYSFPSGFANIEITTSYPVEKFSDYKMINKWLQDNVLECKSGCVIVSLVELKG